MWSFPGDPWKGVQHRSQNITISGLRCRGWQCRGWLQFAISRGGYSGWLGLSGHRGDGDSGIFGGSKWVWSCNDRLQPREESFIKPGLKCLPTSESCVSALQAYRHGYYWYHLMIQGGKKQVLRTAPHLNWSSIKWCRLSCVAYRKQED